MALQRVVDFVKEARLENKITCMISLDIDNAFNSVRWSDIISILKKSGLPGKLTKAIVFRQIERLTCMINPNGNAKNTFVAVPQCSSVGPAIWSMICCARNSWKKMYTCRLMPTILL
ncbi:hypothetical protein AVEN_54819-1 [Araneus ventricosus]|uniref:Reverse transcriptase domain-containing protein n=1 Tax=Araneus ventricosus TaxID=182803 RepID=A0A4Y2EZL1_ARAVE|nr:hypothetical protein AVEN_54819-1 [Araneus ventricosus]